MKKVIATLVLLPAVLFLIIGARWLIEPEAVAQSFGLTLGQGLGRSTLVGDLAAFFLTLGGCMLTALISRRRSWYYPPMMLLSIATLGRIMAWLFHDATLAVPQIAVEVAVSLILMFASRRLPQSN